MLEMFRNVVDKLTSVSSLLMTGSLLVLNFVLCSYIFFFLVYVMYPVKELMKKLWFFLNALSDVEGYAFKSGICLHSLLRWDSLIGPCTDVHPVSVVQS